MVIKNHIKADFPIFNEHPDLVYLDSAATSQKPKIVIDRIANYYRKMNAPVHRSLYDLGYQSTEIFETVRAKTAQFINARSMNEIIFTSGCTMALNLVTEAWAKPNLKAGDIVVVSDMEHHSNLLPWMRLSQTLGIKLHYLPFDQNFRLNYRALPEAEMQKIKVLALTHASNVLGTINPLPEIVSFYRKSIPGIRIVIDAAQSVSHMPINVQDIDADFMAFSAHKMFGPNGVGVLYVKKEHYPAMQPYIVGSHVIESVSKDNIQWAAPPNNFEAGTPNVEGVIGLGAAIEYIQSLEWSDNLTREQELTSYALHKLLNIPDLLLYGPTTKKDRLGVFSIGLPGLHAHDIAEILNRSQICIRAGHHCAQPLMQQLRITSTVRASLHIYNTTQDIDCLVSGLNDARRILQ